MEIHIIYYLLWAFLYFGSFSFSKPYSNGCDKSRKILKNSWGIISDGPSDYLKDTTCQWLIEAEDKNKFINLNFTSMQTECSYDYIFIYDGNSFNSKLLGSFSGHTLPDLIVAETGKLLILLYSDTNYVLSGFVAEYSVTSCPRNCSYHGKCASSICLCDFNYTGSGCQYTICPDNCGQSEDRGFCHQSKGRCICKEGFTGDSCSLTSSSHGNSWHVLSRNSPMFQARTSHGSVYIPKYDRLYVFGGYDLNHVLNDLLYFDFKISQWRNGSLEELVMIQQNDQLLPSSVIMENNMSVDDSYSIPEGRFCHAMINYDDNLLMYGGKLTSGELSSHLWLFNTTSQLWSLLADKSVISPPPLCWHTLTLAGEYVYLFGGSLQNGEFSSQLFRIMPFHGQWESVFIKGGKSLNVRLVGHTTVYHEPSHSLIVFGGITVDIARFSRLSSKMYLFDIRERYWSQINYPPLQEDRVYLERAFHSANIIGNYMVVYGGYSHRHGSEEICYDNKVYLYHLGCHIWIKDAAFIPKNKAHKTIGLYGHSATVRNENTLIISGGYRGKVVDSLLAYKLPTVLVPPDNQSPDLLCTEYTTRESCAANPECGWCQPESACLSRKGILNCTSNLQTGHCPGLCPTMMDCFSCIVHGKGLPDGNRAERMERNWKCSWCVQSAKCHKNDDFPNVCGTHEDTPSGLPGWWGKQGHDLTKVEFCYTKNFQPGLTLLKHRYPYDKDYPDEVFIVNASVANIHFYGLRELSLGGDLVRMRGFIHPGAIKKTKPKDYIRVFMNISNASGTMQLSTDETEENLEVVAKQDIEDSSGEARECRRPSGLNIFPKSSSRKYLLYFEILQRSVGSSMMKISWNVFPNIYEEFSFELLEPYSKGPCEQYHSCLACVSDALCGWCDVTSTCINRTHYNKCRANDDGVFLKLSAHQCANCSDFIYCESCVETNVCEWIEKEAQCTRFGRYANATRSVNKCPTPCYSRKNCTSCLEDPGRCVWCDHTQECFLFSVFTSRYQYGMCREWLDEDQSNDVSKEQGSKCQECYSFKKCEMCLQHLSCGWCYLQENPTIGVCERGDFSGSSTGFCLESSPNITSQDVLWAYGECPDIDECSLGLHECHAEATCVNTKGGYYCQCNRGFTGDGKINCSRTCFERCVHGRCSGFPGYKCNCQTGWTGSDCSINCGCNNHSTCSRGVGICDNCEDWTTGQFCQVCRPGSYGNATTEQGCQVCHCNEHGNKDKDICDVKTGQCYCTHSTTGYNCEHCLPGFYGDPREGGKCYYECNPRGVITELNKGGLGSYLSSSNSVKIDSCLWIITDAHNFTYHGKSTILFTIDSIVGIPCPLNHVYVYDGLPKLVSLSQNWNRYMNLLGTFCTSIRSYPTTLEATSGYLTVFFKKSSAEGGFNATFEVMSCPQRCPKPRVCYDGRCECPKGLRGPLCNIEVCPSNCNHDTGRGYCNEEYGFCDCTPGNGGTDCSESIQPGNIMLSYLYSHELVTNRLDHLRKLIPRFGHTLLADQNDNLWLFGGYSLSRGPLNDLQKFETRYKRWIQLTVEIQPEPGKSTLPVGRYFHGAAYVSSQRAIYVYGGLSSSLQILGDFWKFNIKSHQWQQITARPGYLPLAGHTLTLRQGRTSESLILIGGFSEDHGFLDKVWEYDLKLGAWEELECSGTVPSGIYGHTTVYHSPSKSFYIYGGLLYNFNQTVLSNTLFSFHYPSDHWSVLPINSNYNPLEQELPPKNIFHTAVTTDEYMIVIGSLAKKGDELLAYIYQCNLWVRLLNKDIKLIGPDWIPSIAQSAVYVNNMVVLFGGYNGELVGDLMSFRIPQDLCSLYSNNPLRCKAMNGCAYCKVYSNEGVNTTYCYSNWLPSPESCASPKGTIDFTRGLSCQSYWSNSDRCYHYNTCTECLAVWPLYGDVSNCQWCSRCRSGKCIPRGKTCQQENPCESKQIEVTETKNCDERNCIGSDCEKCVKDEFCFWSRNVLITNENGIKEVSFYSIPIHNWGCAPKRFKASFPDNSGDLGSCPWSCHRYKNCNFCLSSTGAEGGWNECYWASHQSRCFSPSYQNLMCLGGTCGQVLRGETEHCPSTCSQYRQCSHCLRDPECGWCSNNNGHIDGLGLCVEGRLESPLIGSYQPATCERVLYSLDEPRNASWHYFNCPPENECLNDHHTCNNQSEECVDLPEGYSCVCSKGYVKDGSQCKPVCPKGCVYGSCVAPGLCKCHFGYVGANCSIQCFCNGHSDCVGPHEPDVCLECRNNTMGRQCEKCKPLFVGDPQKNGQCIPCWEYCNGHSDICISQNYLMRNVSIELILELHNKKSPKLEELISEGPRNQASCLNCRHNTMGDKCEKCIPGHFQESQDKREHCRPCVCNGHGDDCDAITGENCNCQNNTESDPQCRRKDINLPPSSGSHKPNSKPCWQLQCSKCRESYLGTPTNGHQCYRQMTVETDFCFDPHGQDDCNRKPQPLLQGRTIYFAVQPKFRNVNIRITIDVTQGGVDVFLAPKDDAFIVGLNMSNYMHMVMIDGHYGIGMSSRNSFKFSTSQTKSEKEKNDNVTDIYKNLNLTTRLPTYSLMDRLAEGLTTYITLNDPTTFLIVRNLENRLVVTLPEKQHDLRSTKFYLVLYAVGSPRSEHTFGSLHFRQDQTKIDLFVFFSVFFSCFFLLLAVCIIVFKFKQVYDERRAQRRHVNLLLHMAKRPFASAVVILNEDCSDGLESQTQTPVHRKKRLKLSSYGTPCHTMRDAPRPHLQDNYRVLPIAVEPTDDGQAAVTTVLIQLPGGPKAPIKLTLGSSLVLTSRHFPFGHKTFRRRASM